MRCMTPECDLPAHTRGVCINCYNALFRRVKQGRLTWKYAEQLGYCMPSLKPRKADKASR